MALHVTYAVDTIDGIPVLNADWTDQLPGHHVYRSRDIPAGRMSYVWFIETPGGFSYAPSSDDARAVAHGWSSYTTPGGETYQTFVAAN